MREAFASAAGGAGRLLFLAGEAGIGKTTLAETFLEEIGGGVHVGVGRCS
jgi:predicted ATPase